jgi:AsmA-like protein
MKRPRIRLRLRLRWLVPLAFILLPPLLWALLLSVVPTDWARQRIVARMSEASGRTVRIATLRVGVLGGIYLTGLEIGAPGAAGDPWLKVAEAHLNVSPLQLLCGQVEPTKTMVRGIQLRVLRRANGSLELDDLIQGAPTAPAALVNESGSSSCPLSRLNLRIRDAQVTVIDVPTRTRLEFREVEGRALSEGEGRRATIQELRGTVNGGPFEVVAHLDRSTRSPSFEGQIRAHGIELNQGMSALGYLVPVLSGDSGNLDGTLDIDLYLRGQGASRAELRRTVVGHGAVSLDPIQLEGSRFLAELASFVEMPEQGRIGSIKSDFAIKKGRIVTDNLTVSVTKVPIVLSGWTEFDGRVNYRIRTDTMIERLPSKARDLLADLSIDARELATLKVEGAIDAPRVTIDGIPLNRMTGRGEPGQPRGDDRPKLRELGRRLRDRILR